MISASRALSFKCSPYPTLCSKTHMESPPRTTLRCCTLSRSSSLSPSSSEVERESAGSSGGDQVVSLQEWQAWGTASPVPAMVAEIVEDMKSLERDIDAQMSFGGLGGKLQEFNVGSGYSGGIGDVSGRICRLQNCTFVFYNSEGSANVARVLRNPSMASHPNLLKGGDFKVYEDKKHRAKYQALGDSEKKLQFFSARQIACRLLGSRGYLCQKCWLPLEDCMCSKLIPCSLWHGIRFWLYMHPKDFLRQNNTGKLLWQVFGVQAATLCLYGISEHEQIMWNAFKLAGKDKVWCLYPNKNAPTKSVHDTFSQDSSPGKDKVWCLYPNKNAPTKSVHDTFSRDSSPVQQGGNFHVDSAQTNGDKTLHFVLLDGTWNNSAAMFRRLKDQANEIWGEDLPCISLATGASAMHKLRPQPSWDRTCTAAAAVGLLSELQLLLELSSFGFDKQAEAVEDALVVLLDALTARRLRMGRSISRRERHKSHIC
ncbi:hypothetical protein TEA_007409 [Camellia sinensis var. sinensis]|uniref:tRNA-uridine aminocarboxypropyltransferase n=1 Tax=Camellia sinensis var. sinensis TaxID=542762 RepID=A0A4S4EBS4_CAMSN|nr:hypothetical protein TEA_007409 [Camellia sinensis var. sinensis]